jgi:dCTP deaminase
MILKADEIVRLLKESEGSTDPLVIAPSPEEFSLKKKSGSASVDLRLGTWLASMRNNRVYLLDVYGKDRPVPSEAELMKSHYVPFGREYILQPKAFVLGITLEWIRLPSDLAGYVIGKSSLGRRGLIIATATGVHPGFTGCLTLEISNVGEVPISIKPGMAICQLFLHSTTKSDKVDRTCFMGQRKPALGKVTLDVVAETLGRYEGF